MIILIYDYFKLNVMLHILSSMPLFSFILHLKSFSELILTLRPTGISCSQDLCQCIYAPNLRSNPVFNFRCNIISNPSSPSQCFLNSVSYHPTQRKLDPRLEESPPVPVNPVREVDKPIYSWGHA